MLSGALAIAGRIWSKGSKPQKTLPPDFMSLPLELKIAVVRMCEPADIVVLGNLATRVLLAIADNKAARLSSEMRSITLPILYHSVDLSCHRDRGIIKSSLIDVEPDNPIRADKNGRVVQIIRRQLSFMHTILVHPEYAPQIKSLTWTFFNLVDNSNGGVEVKEGPLWKCFKAMRNIEILDFCSLAMWHEFHTPPPLFFSATIISLGGPMSFALATSILQSRDPALITTLELNNLQDLGQLRKGKNLAGNEDLSVLRETMYPNKTPKVRHPGPMRDHLRNLTGKCTSLRHLALRSLGDDYMSHYFWSATLDEIRYKQWAAFINSVRDTLRTFEFEQGISPQLHNQGGCGTGRGRMPLQMIRPMDERYITFIAPVLIHGPWPALNKVVIRGVGGSVQDRCAHATRIDDLGRIADSHHRLRQALEPKVLLTLEREATKTFYCRANTNYYSS
jgi:hypothetical protein